MKAPVLKVERLRPSLRPPWSNGDRKDWLSVHDFALLYRRQPKTIRRWVHDGTMKEFGIRWYQDITGRIWIYYPAVQA